MYERARGSGGSLPLPALGEVQCAGTSLLVSGYSASWRLRGVKRPPTKKATESSHREPRISTTLGHSLALLKEIAPRLARAVLVADPKSPVHNYFVRSANAAAASLAIEVVSAPVENAADIERVLEAFAHVPDGGLLLPPDITTITHRDLIVMLAARYHLPAIYSVPSLCDGRRSHVLRD